jgi:hypothetical protein
MWGGDEGRKNSPKQGMRTGTKMENILNGGTRSGKIPSAQSSLY